MTDVLATVTHTLASWFPPERLAALLRALVMLVLGVLLARLAGLAFDRRLRHLGSQQRVIARRAVVYTLLGIFTVSALRELGFRFDVLLGAAGIVTVAVGFASQTSASNLISGLFLILERAVEIGEVVRVEGVVGEVLSVDLISTKLRTFDNLLVRIPNETMVKSIITSLNRLPIRRFDLQVGVAYKEDLARVEALLLEVADRNPLCLEEPAPLLISQGFGHSSIDYQLSVWAKREHWLELRNTITREVKTAFDDNDIEIPFPHLSLYTGSASEPLRLDLGAAARPVAGAPAPGARDPMQGGGGTGPQQGSAEGADAPGHGRKPDPRG